MLFNVINEDGDIIQVPLEECFKYKPMCYFNPKVSPFVYEFSAPYKFLQLNPGQEEALDVLEKNRHKWKPKTPTTSK